MGTITRGFANFIGPDGKLQSGSLAAGVGGLAVQSVQTTGFTAVLVMLILATLLHQDLQ
jgi:tetrahydromethanopterin S-methyltransferase subunit F